MPNLVLKQKLEAILHESVPMGSDFGNSRVAKLAKEALVELAKFPFIVFSGSEKFDYGNKTPSAICESEPQALAMIKGLWPTSGYFEHQE